MMGATSRAPTVLCISSQVAFGGVGNAVAIPALERAGISVLGVPTVVLSNHPGFGPPTAMAMPADMLAAMLGRLIDNGWLDRCAGILTGYFVSAEQVSVVARAIRAVKRRNPSCIYLCDPILGDDHTGLYVADAVATAIKDELAGLADVVCPNRFELEWLAGMAVDGLAAAGRAAATLAPATVLGTSISTGQADELVTAVIQAGSVDWVATARRSKVPHGTGDLLAGLFLAGLVGGASAGEALGLAVAQVDHVVAASEGSAVLTVAPALESLGEVAPLMVHRGIAE